MNRKRVILGALLGVLAVCLVYAYLATPRLEKAPPRAAGLRTQPANPGFPKGDEKETQDRIDFAYLTKEPQEFTGSQRDIFQFGQRRPVETASTNRVVKRDGSGTRGPARSCACRSDKEIFESIHFPGLSGKSWRKDSLSLQWR